MPPGNQLSDLPDRRHPNARVGHDQAFRCQEVHPFLIGGGENIRRCALFDLASQRRARTERQAQRLLARLCPLSRNLFQGVGQTCGGEHRQFLRIRHERHQQNPEK
jgi:hypothetical protein